MPQYGPVSNFSVSGKIVVITGGGSGIGFALARLCHEHSARVLIGDLKLTSEAEHYIASATAKETVAFHHCDVTSWTSMRDLIRASVRCFGEVPDAYVPCAGIFEPPWSTFWDDGEEDSYMTLRINVDHPVQFTRLAMRALAGAQKQGVVCLMASLAGIVGNYLACLYATSKHAVVGFAKSMGAADVEEGVKVVCILPNVVQSPLWDNREDDIAERGKYRELLPSALKPMEVAETMLKMMEGQEYGGGTCVAKTTSEETIVEESYSKQQAKASLYPRPPELDLGRIKKLLESEKGKSWPI